MGVASASRTSGTAAYHQGRASCDGAVCARPSYTSSKKVRHMKKNHWATITASGCTVDSRRLVSASKGWQGTHLLYEPSNLVHQGLVRCGGVLQNADCAHCVRGAE